MKEKIFKFATPNNVIFSLSWFLCFSIALPHTILPGKAGSISILLFILWIFGGDLKTKIQTLYESKLFLSVIGFIFILSLSMLWTERSNVGLVRLSTFKYYLFLIPVLITSLTKQNALKLIHAFVLGNILHAFLMILLSYGFINLPSKLNLYNPYSVYGPFFVFSSFYCFYYFRYNLNNKDLIRGLIYLSCSLLLIYLIFINKGRSGQLAFIFSTLVTLALLHKNWRKTAIFLVITAVLVITISISSKTVKSSYTIAMKDITEVIKGNYHGSWGQRWGLLVTNYETVKQNPFFGVGLGDTEDEMQRVIERGGNQASYAMAYFDHSHDYYITILTSTGIIGLIAYILIHVFLFKLPIKNTEIKYLSLIFLTILIVNGFSDDILLYKPYNIYFAIMIALFINLSLDEKDKHIESDKIL